MKELTIDEIKQVNGVFGPAVYDAIVLKGKIAASPFGRAAAKSCAQGFSGGMGAWAMTELSSTTE